MQIAIIGCGNMGKGLAQRLSVSHQIHLYDHHLENTQTLEKEGYGKAHHDLTEAVKNTEIVILAIKPQNLHKSANLVNKALRKDQILVSLLTGTSLETLNEYFPKVCLVRMMPNLALIYGEGVIGLSADNKTEEKYKAALSDIFASLGTVFWLPEEKINALTALTGSGPAFFFVMIEAMIDAGIAMGLNAKEAQSLLYPMLKGSISLLEKSSRHPGEVKWQITSPQGTTIAGLKTLEESCIRGSIINTFLSAYDRAVQLAKNSKI